MKYHIIILLVSILPFRLVKGQEAKSIEISINEYVDGTHLQVPDTEYLAVIIGGSGPIDRDGNQGFSRSSYLKKLAQELAKNKISSFRYDKRVLKQLKSGEVDPETSFEDFILDAKAVLSYFQNLNSYSHITVIGHSQGALVGMLAINKEIAGFISLNGPAKNIGDVLVDQVSQSAPEFADATKRIVESLKRGETTTDYPRELASAFNLETQPFLISWMQYEPSEIMSDLNTKALIVQGAKDLQISLDAAKTLKSTCASCELAVIENMNHVLFEIVGDELENYKSYNDPNFKIAPELISKISQFITSKE